MELPPALTPWRELLSMFPPDIAAALGPLIQRLNLAIGPLAADPCAGEGDPDGIDGIARRGSYERLLISEWLLAEEVPEEFTRRALTAEHSFLKLARLSPSAVRHSTLLLDSGPDQWGAPRIAHLAALIVLARRAAAAGATFEWGILQDAERALYRTVDASHLRMLLADRRERGVTSEDLEAWRTDWSERLVDGDAWVVGGRRAVILDGGGMSTVAVEDPLEPQERRLDATVTARGGAGRTIELPLPDERTCVRLLRDPFAIAVTTPQPAGDFSTPCSNLVFSITGNKLFARAANGGVIAYPVPNSSRAGVGKPRQHLARTCGTIVAAGRFRKATVLLVVGERRDTLTLEFVGGTPRGCHGGEMVVTGANFVVDGNTPLSPIVPAWRDESAEFFAVVGGTLLQIGNIARSTAPVFATIMATRAAAVAPVRGGVAWVFRRDNGWRVSAVHIKQEVTRRPIEGEGTRAFFGYGGAEEDPEYGLLAWGVGGGMWHVQDRNGVRQLKPPGTAEVVGVVAAPGREEHPALVIIDEDRRNVNLLSRGWSQPLARVGSEIRDVAVSPMVPQIAYSTVEGELVVYSLTEEAVVYRLTPGGAGE